MSDIHQVRLTGTKTVQAKLRFEREAASVGVQVKDYCTDNRVYTSKEFATELVSKGQGIKHSGVGGHRHNGVAENAIKHTVRMAHTMMIYSALRWPEHNERDLWPLALSHAVHLHKDLPSMTSRLTPHSTRDLVRSKSSYSAPINSHPWGCPVYVLRPQLQDGGKLPKWEPRSRQGQYIGASPPLHASTVGLIRNLQTNHISPQFHVVYDDLFETVHSGEEIQPASWPDLIICNRFKSDYDDTDFVPELADEWLAPVELSHRQQRENACRNGDDPPSSENDSSQRVSDVSHNLDETASQRAPSESSTPPPETTQTEPSSQRALIKLEEPLEHPPFVDALQYESETPPIMPV
jgi:hypothetical protein